MLEGHEADAYYTRAMLTGIFNRLGDGKREPQKIDPPAWISQQQIATSREEIALARDLFEQALSERQQRGGRAGT